ncbi:IS1/IS1595 family N-terminal zinc-binding domain-containing protein [Deinococcus sp.]|uniref:IS1/IS1595 family N-terminal zinc-binding domain-containing protein n=1 Tax=Deinococcus sp. TaxID=47478 RepID=UPI003CC5B2E5
MNALDCPHCGAVRIVKNGHAHTGKQRYLSRLRSPVRPEPRQTAHLARRPKE